MCGCGGTFKGVPVNGTPYAQKMAERLRRKQERENQQNNQEQTSTDTDPPSTQTRPVGYVIPPNGGPG